MLSSALVELDSSKPALMKDMINPEHQEAAEDSNEHF